MSMMYSFAGKQNPRIGASGFNFKRRNKSYEQRITKSRERQRPSGRGPVETVEEKLAKCDITTQDVKKFYSDLMTPSSPDQIPSSAQKMRIDFKSDYEKLKSAHKNMQEALQLAIQHTLGDTSPHGDEQNYATFFGQTPDGTATNLPVTMLRGTTQTPPDINYSNHPSQHSKKTKNGSQFNRSSALQNQRIKMSMDGLLDIVTENPIDANASPKEMDKTAGGAIQAQKIRLLPKRGTMGSRGRPSKPITMENSPQQRYDKTSVGGARYSKELVGTELGSPTTAYRNLSDVGKRVDKTNTHDTRVSMQHMIKYNDSENDDIELKQMIQETEAIKRRASRKGQVKKQNTNVRSTGKKSNSLHRVNSSENSNSQKILEPQLMKDQSINNDLKEELDQNTSMIQLALNEGDDYNVVSKSLNKMQRSGSRQNTLNDQPLKKKSKKIRVYSAKIRPERLANARGRLSIAEEHNKVKEYKQEQLADGPPAELASRPGDYVKQVIARNGLGATLKVSERTNPMSNQTEDGAKLPSTVEIGQEFPNPNDLAAKCKTALIAAITQSESQTSMQDEVSITKSTAQMLHVFEDTVKEHFRYGLSAGISTAHKPLLSTRSSMMKNLQRMAMESSIIRKLQDLKNHEKLETFQDARVLANKLISIVSNEDMSEIIFSPKAKINELKSIDLNSNSTKSDGLHVTHQTQQVQSPHFHSNNQASLNSGSRKDVTLNSGGKSTRRQQSARDSHINRTQNNFNQREILLPNLLIINQQENVQNNLEQLAENQAKISARISGGRNSLAATQQVMSVNSLHETGVYELIASPSATAKRVVCLDTLQTANLSQIKERTKDVSTIKNDLIAADNSANVSTVGLQQHKRAKSAHLNGRQNPNRRKGPTDFITRNMQSAVIKTTNNTKSQQRVQKLTGDNMSSVMPLSQANTQSGSHVFVPHTSSRVAPNEVWSTQQRGMPIKLLFQVMAAEEHESPKNTMACNIHTATNSHLDQKPPVPEIKKIRHGLHKRTTERLHTSHIEALGYDVNTKHTPVETTQNINEQISDGQATVSHNHFDHRYSKLSNSNVIQSQNNPNTNMATPAHLSTQKDPTPKLVKETIEPSRWEDDRPQSRNQTSLKQHSSQLMKDKCPSNRQSMEYTVVGDPQKIVIQVQDALCRSDESPLQVLKGDQPILEIQNRRSVLRKKPEANGQFNVRDKPFDKKQSEFFGSDVSDPNLIVQPNFMSRKGLAQMGHVQGHHIRNRTQIVNTNPDLPQTNPTILSGTSPLQHQLSSAAVAQNLNDSQRSETANLLANNEQPQHSATQKQIPVQIQQTSGMTSFQLKNTQNKASLKGFAFGGLMHQVADGVTSRTLNANTMRTTGQDVQTTEEIKPERNAKSARRNDQSKFSKTTQPISAKSKQNQQWDKKRTFSQNVTQMIQKFDQKFYKDDIIGMLQGTQITASATSNGQAEAGTMTEAAMVETIQKPSKTMLVVDLSQREITDLSDGHSVKKVEGEPAGSVSLISIEHDENTISHEPIQSNSPKTVHETAAIKNAQFIGPEELKAMHASPKRKLVHPQDIEPKSPEQVRYGAKQLEMKQTNPDFHPLNFMAKTALSGEEKSHVHKHSNNGIIVQSIEGSADRRKRHVEIVSSQGNLLRSLNGSIINNQVEDRTETFKSPTSNKETVYNTQKSNGTGVRLSLNSGILASQRSDGKSPPPVDEEVENPAIRQSDKFRMLPRHNNGHVATKNRSPPKVNDLAAQHKRLAAELITDVEALPDYVAGQNITASNEYISFGGSKIQTRKRASEISSSMKKLQASGEVAPLHHPTQIKVFSSRRLQQHKPVVDAMAEADNLKNRFMRKQSNSSASKIQTQYRARSQNRSISRNSYDRKSPDYGIGKPPMQGMQKLQAIQEKQKKNHIRNQTIGGTKKATLNLTFGDLDTIFKDMAKNSQTTKCNVMVQGQTMASRPTPSSASTYSKAPVTKANVVRSMRSSNQRDMTSYRLERLRANQGQFNTRSGTLFMNKKAEGTVKTQRTTPSHMIPTAMTPSVSVPHGI